jgi:hypothetical protein
MNISFRIVMSAVVATLMLASARPAWAQSLADVAKQEEARRKTVKTPAKVISNKDLVPVLPPATAQTGGEAAPSTQAPGSQPAAGAQGSEKPGAEPGEAKDAAPVKDQAYWAGKKKELQQQLDRDQTYAEAMQTRINSLTTDFTNRDDPAQRAAIGNDRQKSIAELDRLKGQIEKDKKALADFSEDARKASVPAGWLR